MTRDEIRFTEFLRLALYGAGTSRMELGGVTFWVDGDVYRFSGLPKRRWNAEKIWDDLHAAMEVGVERANKVVETLHEMR